MLEQKVELAESSQISEGVGKDMSENEHFYSVYCILITLGALSLAQSLK